MKSLPTLRRKILRSFSMLVGLYAVLGFLLVMSVNIASKTTPKLLHLNYDSISAAVRMNEAWTALRYADFSSKYSHDDWIRIFNEALSFEEHNITEPGEKEIAKAIRSDWEKSLGQLGKINPTQFQQMRGHLDDILAVNESGMFNLAFENEKLSREVMIGSVIYFVISLVLSMFFADQLSQRLSGPLKGIAEALHRRPGFSRKLKLPEPTNLEILILTTELQRLWAQLSESDKINVAEVLKQKSKLETLLESVDDGLLVLNPDGRVSHCNDCLATLVGLPKEQIQGQLWSDLPTLSENYLKLRGKLQESMPEAQQVELDWRGTLSYFSARSRKIEGAQQEGSGILYLLHDITEKKQREKFRSEFIDLLSHELKTPLQSLGTASELLTAQKAGFSEDVRALVDTISEDVERIRAVAQEFVQVTQSHSKIMKLKMQMVAINQVLSEWIKPFMLVAKDRNVKIELLREGSEVIWANLDLVKFPWVISNILSNAVRFSPNGGLVTVLLTDRSGSVEIQIRDEGPGIPESERERIFEPFYQSPQLQMATGSGSRGLFGIGLTIAKEVLEAHDGRIEYYSLQPHGSEFRILLPFPSLQYGEASQADKGDTKSWTH